LLHLSLLVRLADNSDPWLLGREITSIVRTELIESALIPLVCSGTARIEDKEWAINPFATGKPTILLLVDESSEVQRSPGSQLEIGIRDVVEDFLDSFQFTRTFRDLSDQHVQPTKNFSRVLGHECPDAGGKILPPGLQERFGGVHLWVFLIMIGQNQSPTVDRTDLSDKLGLCAQACIR
jgi:hypothetical protein